LRDVNACLNEISKENDFERQKRRERALLNDSLRYDILKRDRFTCAICGATKDDGAKLHVDHIKPIAKGGKTVPENLRTLCDRCNLGKKAKYDPNGLN
jgi:5-methylcytosine-specific restriction endonuclease McrA